MGTAGKEVLGIIVARGGSKSIPKKSIYPCAGNSLIYYTIQAAKKAPTISRLIISTDDPEMAAVARSHGVEVPFMRPAELAQDDTLDLPVFQHALEWLEREEKYVPDVVVHLRPTTPLKKASDIDAGVAMLLSNPDAESVRSICEPHHTPFKMYRLKDDRSFLEPILQQEHAELYAQHTEPYNMPRQKLPVIWRHSGYVDVIRPEVIRRGSMSGTKILPLKFEKWRDVDIDTRRDLEYAAMIIEELRKKSQNPWD